MSPDDDGTQEHQLSKRGHHHLGRHTGAPELRVGIEPEDLTLCLVLIAGAEVRVPDDLAAAFYDKHALEVEAGISQDTNPAWSDGHPQAQEVRSSRRARRIALFLCGSMCLTHLFGVVRRGMSHELGTGHPLYFRLLIEDIQGVRPPKKRGVPEHCRISGAPLPMTSLAAEWVRTSGTEKLPRSTNTTYTYESVPSVVDPMVDLLVEFAGGGPVLEFAIGTGRIALPLSARGVPVYGIELSPHMVEQLQRKPGAEAIAVVIGDMAKERLSGSFELVYVVANSIMNLTTQDEQLEVFANAAAHLAPGGHFVVELIVPQLRRVPLRRPAGSSRWIPTTWASRLLTTT